MRKAPTARIADPEVSWNEKAPERSGAFFVAAFGYMPTKVGIYQSNGIPGSCQPWLALSRATPQRSSATATHTATITTATHCIGTKKK